MRSTFSNGIYFDAGDRSKLYLSNDILSHESTEAHVKFNKVRSQGLYPPLWRKKIDEKHASVQLMETAGTALTGNVWLKLREYCVAAVFSLDCHINEVYPVLIQDDEFLYESVMRSLFTKKFKCGQILHAFENVNDASKSNVKKATFTNALGKEFELFFTDSCIDRDLVQCATKGKNETKSSFTRVVCSIPREFHEGIAKSSILGGAKQILVGYHVEATQADRTNIFFYGSCSVDLEGENPELSLANGDVRQQVGNMARPVQLLACWGRSCNEIYGVIKRRRLGYQHYISINSRMYHSLKGKVHCAVCSKVLNRFVRFDVFCQLCGCQTCSMCSSDVQVEFGPGKIRNNRVCVGCRTCVNQCTFDDPQLRLLGTSPISDIAIDMYDRPNALNRTQNGEPTSKLEDSRLIEYLFSLDTVRQTHALERFGVVLPQGNSQATQSQATALEKLFREHLSCPLHLSMMGCEFANDRGLRNYALNFSDGHQIPEIPTCRNEAARLDTINRLQLLDKNTLSDTRWQLEIVCHMAAKILQCKTAFISIVDEGLQHAIADYEMPLKLLRRRESICAHALTCEKPWIVRDALQDIRYSKFYYVSRTGFRFYASFPVEAPIYQEGVLAGLVVMDKEPKAVITVQQYARMITLSKILTELLAMILQ
ncbi:unnamed protein product [Albugo candida]|uniref:4Fe-4S ferredoxin-type domain-containing protein n=1 Tax=Albugo candida TaxID=65357 RepID=A0A024GLT6_9STRA|nr:unnamed protein product [Albugo candida]|eukprot:CCI47302.1 unnamed protein product [Albugo candida]